MEQRVIDGPFVLGGETSGAREFGGDFCGIDESLINSTDSARSPAKSRSRVNLLWTREWGMGKGLVASLMLHAVVVMLVIVSSGNVERRPETVTVFLVDAGSMGERGSLTEAQARGSERLVRPPGARVGRSAYRERTSPGAATPSAGETVNETQTNKITAAEISTSSAALAGKPAAAAAEDAAQGQGTAGGAGTATAGAGSNGSGSTFSADQGIAGSADGGRKEYLANNFGYIRDLIVKNLNYPYTARRMGWKGSVTVAFVIVENGTVEALRVIKSSGYDLLDQSVVTTVRELQPFPRPPTRAEVVVPIAFRLE